MTLKIKLLAFCMIFALARPYAQHGYTYRRDISGISGPWHRITLPPELVGKTTQSLSDIRVLGIAANGDTIEAPYLLQRDTEHHISTDVEYKLINSARRGKLYYFTFEVPEGATVSEIKTEFAQPNYDWKVNIEGSHNQNEWFTIIENYRILSIKNDQTDFQFTNISFAPANYRYLRMSIQSNEQPELKKAALTKLNIKEGVWNTFTVIQANTENNKVNRTTQIDIDLGVLLPVSRLRLYVADSLDYYRNISIGYLADSTITEKGMLYQYSNLLKSTMHSLQINEFTFTGTILRKLRIEIYNGDNAPLDIADFTVQGYRHELLVRFAEPASYFLVYGSSHARAPVYDISRFADKIPENSAFLQLGTETRMDTPRSATEGLFTNKLWLWALMGIIILVLGGFSLKMLRPDNK